MALCLILLFYPWHTLMELIQETCISRLREKKLPRLTRFVQVSCCIPRMAKFVQWLARTSLVIWPKKLAQISYTSFFCKFPEPLGGLTHSTVLLAGKLLYPWYQKCAVRLVILYSFHLTQCTYTQYIDYNFNLVHKIKFRSQLVM